VLIITGICGSDMHGYLSGGVGGRPVVEPLVMGHESAGEVIAVGEHVKTHKVGDRVAGTSQEDFIRVSIDEDSRAWTTLSTMCQLQERSK
jgi:NADPH:quinone reductase-like Zn-dependent oxidoreductase